MLTKVLSLEAGKRELARGLSIQLKLGEHSAGVLDHIAPILQRAAWCVSGAAHHQRRRRPCYLRLGEAFRVNPSAVSVSELERWSARAGCALWDRAVDGTRSDL